MNESWIDTINPVPNLVSTIPISIDTDKIEFDELWEYTTIIEMIIYLAHNICPGITHTSNWCTWFIRNPRKVHTVEIRYIIRYL